MTGVLPQDLPAVMPLAIREKADRPSHCRGCGHNLELHFVPAKRPWRCCVPRCHCPGMDHQTLDDWVADWLAHRSAQARPTIPRWMRDSVLKRDGLVCRYCTRRVHTRRRGPGKLHIDHVIPWSRGGRHEVENLAVSCRKCNLAKSDDPTITPPNWPEADHE